MELQSVVSLMADGKFHSGEALGEVLGVSRTAVWKYLQKLDQYGLVVESVRGRGYRLCGGVELLSEVAIRSGLSNDAAQVLTELDIVPTIDSTNARAMLKASSSGCSGYVCLAEHQVQGRGRRGRRWESPFGQNIYLSVVMEFSQGASALEGLSLTVGVAIVRALARLGVRGVGLKWPNDVLFDDKKLAGVLLEMTGDPSGECRVVVGVGLNFSMSEEAALIIDQPWVNVSDIASGVSRNDLAGALLNELLLILGSYNEKGFSAYRDEWEASHVHSGRKVILSTPLESFEGRVAGLTEAGGLKLLIDGVEREFSGGEVSLRGGD